jgi:hypothetical protein
LDAEFSLVKLVLCGPGAVKKEIEIAQEMVTEWNLTKDSWTNAI